MAAKSNLTNMVLCLTAVCLVCSVGRNVRLDGRTYCKG